MATLLIPGVGLVPDDSALLIPGAGIVQAGAAAVTVTGTAATIAFSVGAGSIVQKQIVTGTGAAIAFSVGAGNVWQAEFVVGTAAEIRFSVGTGVIAQGATITGTPAEIAFSVGTGTVRQDMRILGTPAEITWTAGTGNIWQAESVIGTAAEWAFSTGTGVITQASGVGGKLTRRRRTRSRYWPDTELDVLVDALGRHPIERDPRTLRAEARLGLTQVITSGQPVAVSYADDALLLDLVGQQIRVSGALKKHVEQLIDDEDVADILHLIA